MSKVHALSHRITNKPCTSSYYICDYRLEKQTLMLRSMPQMLKKMKNRRKQNFEGEANKVQLDKEDTRQSKLNGKCIFNILILLLFISCSMSLLVKYGMKPE